METESSYQLAQADTNSNRLHLLETLYDPNTFERLQAIGVTKGWRCFVPGAGEGSVVNHLSEMVGPSGSVLATDVRPRAPCAGDPENVTWIQHDITMDRMSSNRFDLVCVRLLLMHLTDPLMAMRKIAAALRPGGWLLVEEYELSSPEDANMPLVDFWQGVARHWEQLGQNFTIGRDLESLVGASGLDLRWAQRSPNVLLGGSPEAEFQRLTVLQVKQILLGGGELTEKLLNTTLTALKDPGLRLYGPMLTATAAQKPAAKAHE
jgi:SAM-dependent methyltransferase